MHKKLAVFWLALMLAGGVAAQALPADLALTEYLQLVRQRSPGLLADRSLVDMARADLRTASTLPNPAVSYSRGAGDRQVGIEQPLPIFGQRGQRMEGARKGIESTQANVEAVAADALKEAAARFVALLAAQARSERWREARVALDRAVTIVEGQVTAGARSRYDLTRIRLESANVDMQLAQSEAAESGASAAVASAVGVPEWRPRAIGTLRPPDQATDFASRWEIARQRLPAVRAALAAESLAETLVSVERREALPTPSIGVGRLRDSDGRHTLIGVSVEIPLFDRREGPIARALAVADESRQRRRAVVLAAEADLRRAVEQLQRRELLTSRFQASGLSLLPELGRMAQDAYQLGRGSILELVDAILAGAEKQVAYVDLLEAVQQAELDVRFASGSIPVGEY